MKDSQPKQSKRQTLSPDQNTIAALQQQVNELTEALQRERADSINIRRRSEEERSAMSVFYKSMVISEILPALDNLERALKHAPRLSKDDGNCSTISAWIEGIEKVSAHFYKALADLGVERIATVGQLFDPKYHEAVSMEEGEGSRELVSEELQPGYKIGDDVIRHAMVKVRMGK
jgi:molecular chaperone GrpE